MQEPKKRFSRRFTLWNDIEIEIFCLTKHVHLMLWFISCESESPSIYINRTHTALDFKIAFRKAWKGLTKRPIWTYKWPLRKFSAVRKNDLQWHVFFSNPAIFGTISRKCFHCKQHIFSKWNTLESLKEQEIESFFLGSNKNHGNQFDVKDNNRQTFDRKFTWGYASNKLHSLIFAMALRILLDEPWICKMVA